MQESNPESVAIEWQGRTVHARRLFRSWPALAIFIASALVLGVICSMAVFLKAWHEEEGAGNRTLVVSKRPHVLAHQQSQNTGGLIDERELYGVLLASEANYQISRTQTVIRGWENRVAQLSEVQQYIREDSLAIAEQLQRYPSIRPVTGGRVTDNFGMRRDPFTRRRKHHSGLDISVSQGTEVAAAAAGNVIKAKTRYSRNRGYGREVIIDHGFGLRTRYAHLSRVLVEEGGNVTRGQVIGLVGQTGRSTAPHLHYEVWLHDCPVEPTAYILNDSTLVTR